MGKKKDSDANQDGLTSRKFIENKLNRIYDYINDSKNLLTVNDLNMRLKMIDSYLTEYNEVLNETCETEEELSINETDLINFEDNYFKTKGLVMRMIDDIKDKSKQLQSLTSNKTKPKLPEIPLPTFDGSYDKWLEFENMFKTLIDQSEISPSIKLFYLKKSLLGEAKDFLESERINDESYEGAWNHLEKRYANKRVIVENHVADLFELRNMKRNCSVEIRMLIDGINKHIRGLHGLGQEINGLSERFVIHIITTKLDKETRKEWESAQYDTEFPKFKETMNFLEQRFRIMEKLERNVFPNNNNKSETTKINKPKAHHTTLVSQQIQTAENKIKCAICSLDHFIFHCDTFKNLPSNERFSKIKGLSLCVNCFGKGHYGQNCKSQGRCRKCSMKHHTLLHYERNMLPKPKNETSQIEATESTATNLFVRENQVNHVLLTTAIVKVQDKYGTQHPARVLLDSGSQINLVTEEFAQMLNLKRSYVNDSIIGINGNHVDIKSKISINMQSTYNDYTLSLDCLVISKITGNIPSVEINANGWNIPSSIQLADNSFGKPGKIDILLGAEMFYQILRENRSSIGKDLPNLQETEFGYIITGKVSQKRNFALSCNPKFDADERLDDIVQKFWEVESFTAIKSYTAEEKYCEDHFMKNHTRNNDGRYIVKLPLKETVDSLGYSYNLALKRFHNLEHRLKGNPELFDDYKTFINEYLALGHMKLCDAAENIPGKHYYLPHHAVLKPQSTTTKLRVVFDASAQTSSGASLNEMLYVGRVKQELMEVILRFRKHKYVFTADIEKMFRQIMVSEDHQQLQRILWRENETSKIKEYQLTTVTYGTACAPYLASRVLQQLASDEAHILPLAAEITKSDFYVDDLLSGANSIDEASLIQKEIISLMHKGGFRLRKWSSNSDELLNNIDKADREISSVTASVNNLIKTLGIIWDPSNDKFQFHIKPLKLRPEVTKRSILSEIATLFDPMGLLGPVIVKAKIMLQQLWKLKLGWDEVVPISVAKDWSSYRESLTELNGVSIDRCIIDYSQVDISMDQIELHGFGDSSEHAYGACIYVRTKISNDNYCVRLLCSKSRISPLKTQTIPRLELCAAHLLAILAERIISSMKIKFTRICLWSDSSIVLCWIKKAPYNFPTFIANRVAIIQEKTESFDWRHIGSKLNPADIISRGQTPDLLMKDKQWWNGPQFLQRNESNWPTSNWQLKEDQIPELKSRADIVACHITTAISNPLFIYSSFRKMKRIFAYLLRFISNVRLRKTERVTGLLTVNEMINASTTIIKLAQKEIFLKEINQLKSSKPIHNQSALKGLNPEIDSQGLLRVGGRLNKSNLNFDHRHPIILPAKHCITEMIIQSYHVEYGHAGQQLLRSILRQTYWPLKLKVLMKKIINKCIVCFRARPKVIEQPMGSLPATRVNQNFPFAISGVDYAGPFYIRMGNCRSKTYSKAYVCIFICLVSKAIHLEMATDMTTESFIAALHRFVSRRGNCQQIYSDNGTNFVGAQAELKQLRKLFESQIDMKKINDFCVEREIEWVFIPPRSPHFGGLWEAGVKSMKFHLKRMSGNAHLTYEEMLTLLTQVEGILNSRPLTPLNDDPSDLAVLTPAHFLIGREITCILEPDLSSITENRLGRWQRIQKIKQHFWNRWLNEYLSELQQHNKWNGVPQELKLGQLVILKDENLPPMKWTMGRIVELYTGKDKVVRVVGVKTASGVKKRAVAKVCLLPVEVIEDSKELQGRENVRRIHHTCRKN